MCQDIEEKNYYLISESVNIFKNIVMLLLFHMNKNKIIMKFSQCGSVLYDEEIMAGWTPEDSNLNTICCWCKHPTVPNLSIKVHTFIIY